MSLPVLIAAGGEDWEADLVAAVVETSGLEVVRRCVDVADAVATASSGMVAAALVSVGVPGLDADVVRRMSDCDVVVVAVTGSDDQAGSDDHAGSDDQAVPRAAALGISAVVARSNLGAVASIVSAARVRGGSAASLRVPDGDNLALPRDGRLTAVWSPPGAPGRSTLARGIAAEAAARGRRTLLVDADVDGGTQAPALALLDEVSGLLSAARAANEGSLDPARLTSMLRWLSPDLGVLTGLPRAERWPSLRAASYERVLEVACTIADMVVVDLGTAIDDVDEQAYDSAAPRRSAVTRYTLTVADQVVVVGTPDPVGLSRLARAVLDVRSAFDVRPCVVVNQVRSTLGWSTDEVAAAVQRFTGEPPMAFLPYDRVALDHCLVHGLTPAEGASNSAFRRALVTLVDELALTPAQLA